jgi:tRNA G18 (ribose-2'-O)-methylase SpoU
MSTLVTVRATTDKYGRMAHVAELIEVGDVHDPCLRDYVALTDMELRKRTEPERGLYIAEGRLVIERALAAGHPLRSMLLSTAWVERMRPLIETLDGPVYVGTPELLEKVTGFHVHRGALAAMGRPALPPATDVLAGARRVLVLERLANHTNVGAVFRAAAGLGMDAVLLSPDCADPLYRRSVKVSMGTVFAVPYALLEPWPAALDTLREAGFLRLALTPAPDAVPLPELRLGEGQRVALLFGTEGDGLTARALDAVDVRVRIPMTAGVDSLNVAAAAAVACYALTHAPAG